METGKVVKTVLRAAGLLLVLFLLVLVFRPEFYAGFLYPKINFGVKAIDSSCIPEPVVNHDPAKGVFWGFMVDFNGGEYGSFYHQTNITFYTREPWQKLEIHSFGYEWEGGSGILKKNRSYQVAADDPEWEENETQDWSWYWMDLSDLLVRMNFTRLFRGKEVGDEFDFNLVFSYRLDGREITQRIRYRVKAYKTRIDVFPNIVP